MCPDHALGWKIVQKLCNLVFVFLGVAPVSFGVLGPGSQIELFGALVEIEEFLAHPGGREIILGPMCEENVELSQYPELDCNHVVDFPLESKISIIGLPNLRRTINSFYKEVGLDYQIPSNEVISISPSNLEIVSTEFFSKVEGKILVSG